MTPAEFTDRMIHALFGIEEALWTLNITVAVGIVVAALIALLRRERR